MSCQDKKLYQRIYRKYRYSKGYSRKRAKKVAGAAVYRKNGRHRGWMW